MERKNLRIPIEPYRLLVKAKGRLQMETELELSFGDVVGALAQGFLEDHRAERVVQELRKKLSG